MVNQVEAGRTQPTYRVGKRIFDYLEKVQMQNQKRVEEICNKPVVSLGPKDTVDDAMRKMKNRQISQIPILKGGTCIGLVTEDRIATLTGSDSDKTMRLERVIESPPPTVHVGHPANPMKNLLSFSKCILVMQNRKIFGIITSQDLFKLIE